MWWFDSESNYLNRHHLDQDGSSSSTGSTGTSLCCFSLHADWRIKPPDRIDKPRLSSHYTSTVDKTCARVTARKVVSLRRGLFSPSSSPSSSVGTATSTILLIYCPGTSSPSNHALSAVRVVKRPQISRLTTRKRDLSTRLPIKISARSSPSAS